MPLESFYGGKQGVAPVIKKSYSSIDEMKNASDIRYGEMCLIDTVSKNDKDNGKLFRRIFGTGSEPNVIQGYEYIGQIVGPTSAPPTIEIKESIEKLKEEIKTAPSADTPYPIKKYNFRNENNEEQTGVDGNQANSLLVSNFEISTSTDLNKIGGLVSGASHHSIKYSWVNVELTQADGTFSTKALLGFEIPYPEFTTTIKPLPFNQAPAVAISHNNIDGPNTPNPFYHNIAFEVPVGIPGCSVSNIKIKNTNDCCFFEDKQQQGKTMVYFYKSISVNYDQENETYKYTFERTQPTEVDSSIKDYLFDDPDNCTTVKRDQKILVYDLKYQNKSNSGITLETKTCFLDFYYGVESISLEKKSSLSDSDSAKEYLSPSELKIEYSSENPKHSKEQILGSLPYVNELQLDKKTGLVSYKLATEPKSDDTKHKLGYLKSIEQMTITNGGYLLVLYSSSEDRKPEISYYDNNGRLQTFIVTEEYLTRPSSISDAPNIPSSFVDINGDQWEYFVSENANYTLSEKFKSIIQNAGIEENYLLWKNLGKVRVDHYREGLKVASMFDWSYYALYNSNSSTDNPDSWIGPSLEKRLELAGTAEQMCTILNKEIWTENNSGSIRTKRNPYYYGNCTPSVSTDDENNLIIKENVGDTERVLICPIYYETTDEDGERTIKSENWGFFYNRNTVVEQNNGTSKKQGEWIAIGSWNLSLSDSDTTNIGLLHTNENNQLIESLFNSKQFDWGFAFLADTKISESSSLRTDIFSNFWT